MEDQKWANENLSTIEVEEEVVLEVVLEVVDHQMVETDSEMSDPGLVDFEVTIDLIVAEAQKIWETFAEVTV